MVKLTPSWPVNLSKIELLYLAGDIPMPPENFSEAHKCGGISDVIRAVNLGAVIDSQALIGSLCPFELHQPVPIYPHRRAA